MSESQFNYDEMVQDALRGVVREILRRVMREGLPGAHHFYIAFRTRAPGVIIPEHLKKRYPDDMTIVVQHRFWGLEVADDHFVIGLSFNHKPERLVIPFNAVVGFVDPSVQFALQFQDEDASGTSTEDEPVALDTVSAEPESDAQDTSHGDDGTTNDDSKVVALDAFRKKT
ncbi:hypothetical protein JCM17844_22420 [Iodidimonas gelatinilytica]|uniref:Stringent starvation protein B n=1 Tax=Iodidimonas gelatinilytica TaxID=1236966 RepID=A0A5A7N0E8_9PROT|nr:ClpXP protease specificity-enhancing factor SspB [Iodidimonas gelatinilytica]GEQ98605.1 hypothetical protein JCM17844_22420 [Iodidimonas gelatinilytica]GER01801.1 hypothetical protein JCM17845_24240 [Iodidimonas gelatinilytica]